jgi:cytochrome c oxidase cbb3-type subunit III
MKILFAALLCATAFGQTPHPSPFAELTSTDLSNGKRLFEAQCALCHGMNGAGGKGANLAVTKFKRAADDAGLVDVVRGGIDGTSMPAAWWMSERESLQVAYYVRSLGRTAIVKVGGSPHNGKELFESKAGCAGCHIVSGSGGSLGPDLTDIGARRSPTHLRTVLANPAGAMPEGFLVIRVVDKSGKETRGIRLNEDSFTLQLKDFAGGFHSFQKSSVRSIEKLPRETPMPSYNGKLSENDLDDMVAYLVSLRGE